MINQKILISTRSFGEYEKSSLEKLRKSGYEIVLNPYGRKLNPSETILLLEGVTGLIAGTESLSKDVLESAKKLKVISRCGTGMENVDLNATKLLGIKVFNTPDAPTEAVAELALGLILDILRRISQADHAIRHGKWSAYMGNLFYGKTLGIIGLGRIGRRLVELTEPLKLNILACEDKPDKTFVKKWKINLCGLKKLLNKSDIVSLHLPLTGQTRNIIGENELSVMKPSAVLVNTARGGLVDEDALFDALRNKAIAGAGLDVFAEEPYQGKLKDVENIVLSCHMGGYAVESRNQMEMEATDNLLKGLE